MTYQFSRADEHPAASGTYPQSTGRFDLIVVGSGFFGLTVAERVATQLASACWCSTAATTSAATPTPSPSPRPASRCTATARTCSTPRNKRVWDYVNQFTEFTNYQHRVFAMYKGQVYQFPMNLGLINAVLRHATSPRTRRAR